MSYYFTRAEKEALAEELARLYPGRGVYSIWDMMTGECVYVGQTTRSFGQRFAEHVAYSWDERKTEKIYGYIREKRREGHRFEFRVEVDTVRCYYEYDLNMMEYTVIEQYKQKGHPLQNMKMMKSRDMTNFDFFTNL